MTSPMTWSRNIWLGRSSASATASDRLDNAEKTKALSPKKSTICVSAAIIPSTFVSAAGSGFVGDATHARTINSQGEGDAALMWLNVGCRPPTTGAAVRLSVASRRKGRQMLSIYEGVNI
jgi:hypothetical protein